MFLKAKILEPLLAGVNRYFKVNLLAKQTQNYVQFHSGGDDYNPPPDAEGLGGSIGDNKTNGFLFAWRDLIPRKCQSGEKRIYAVKEDKSLAGEIYLKNDGVIEITPGTDLKIVVLGNTTIDTTGDLTLNAANIKSSGNWSHTGKFKATKLESDNGKTGIYTQSVTVDSGIVTEGK